MDELVVRLLDRVGPIRLDLDSLPPEASGALADALGRSGFAVIESAGEPAQVLDLTHADPSEWESVLGSKARHELRRKRRRYRERHGPVSVESDRDYFQAFVSLHRGAAGEKGEFMTTEMEAFFFELLSLPEASIDVLSDGDRVLAAAFGFVEPDGYYLYNSAFDQTAGDASPGIVLTDALIARAVQDGAPRFDFLKGTERYKQRLGARERSLVRLEATR
jgi:CelD/BcsL family acetyltransferase involved in cellulose biosynthesis